MRLDHCIKQIFILPGFMLAYLLTHKINMLNLAIAFCSVTLTASANYVINEWLDADYDKFHPTKKNRNAQKLNAKLVWLQWGVLICVSLLLGSLINSYFVVMQIWLLLMGIAYNVKPLRTKDIFLLDVLTESINNLIRLLLGWFVVETVYLPPCSIALGYWMLGAFLMAMKRYSEFRMIGDPIVAGHYRKSFRVYTEKSLMVSAFFYAICSIFFIGIFLIKYRVELIIFIPFLTGLFCYYVWISFDKDSAVQNPEKLYREKWLMLYCVFLLILFTVLMSADIPALNIFTDTNLIRLL